MPLATTFMQDSAKLAAELGPIFRREYFNLEFTFVCEPALVAELSDERRFVKHVLPNLAALRTFLGDGLITADTDDPQWHAAHEVLAAGFTRPAMRGHHAMMLDVAGPLKASWDAASTAGEPVDVTAAAVRATLEINGRAGFGYSFGAFDRTRPHPFVTALADATLHSLRSVTRPPLIGGLLGERAEQRHRADIDTLNTLVDQVIATRAAAPADDLLSLMLASGRLDPAQIRHQILTFLSAGYETTSSTLALALYFLATHPDVRARARAEVDAVCGDAPPDFDQIGKLRYLRRVIDETMRLWPAAPGWSRRAREDTLLGDRYPMRAGDTVFVLLPALHRDIVWGPDPDAFDPDRFLPERVRARPAHAFKPFGTGIRACIGRQFAAHQLVLLAAVLVRDFDLEFPPGHRLQVREAVTFQPVGLLAQVSRSVH